MNKAIIITMIIVVGALVVGAYKTLNKENSSANSQNSSITTQSSQSNQSTSVQTTNGETNVSLSVDDNTSSQTTISVSRGTKVNITFNVADGTDDGGLQFKSDDGSVDSGRIKPGESKTVSFTAEKSITIKPYAPYSQIKKNYTVKVNVQ